MGKYFFGAVLAIVLSLTAADIEKKDKCVHEGKEFRPGQRRQEDCNWCTCAEIGGWMCTLKACPPRDKCYNRGKSYDVGQIVRIGTRTCRCVSERRWACKRGTSPSKDRCIIDGKTYKAGEKFVDEKCTGYCTCRGPAWGCVSLCPPTNIRCPPGQKIQRKNVNVMGTKCTCPKLECVGKDYCEFQGKRYRNGESFIDPQCQMRCFCRAPRHVCVPLCPLRGIKCAYPATVVNERKRVPGSRCTCPFPKCVIKDEKLCKFEGKEYKMGEYFISEDCTARCRCRGEGHSCVSLCPPRRIRCPKGQKIVQERVSVSSRCTCPRPKCVPKVDEGGMSCTFEGKTYKDGEDFVDDKCRASCKCRGGTHGCVSLCPPYAIGCPPGQKIVEERIPVSEKCTCPRPKCVPKDDESDNQCTFEGKQYKKGEYFTNKACTARCQCRGMGYACVSLCPPRGIQCPPGQKIVQERVPVMGRCSCQRPKCVPKDDESENSCTFEGKQYKQGEYFINKECTGRCQCSGKGHACVSLCPPRGIQCPPGQKIVNERVRVSKRCSCPRPKCVPKGIQKSCTFEGKSYNEGKYFTDENCTMRCKCQNGHHSCVSLCPPMGIRCPPGQKQVEAKVAVSKRCTCSRPKCVPKA